MVKYRLTKKAIILLVVLFVVLGGAGGYIFWRLNSGLPLNPFDAAAGGNASDVCSNGVAGCGKCNGTQATVDCFNNGVKCGVMTCAGVGAKCQCYNGWQDFPKANGASCDSLCPKPPADNSGAKCSCAGGYGNSCGINCQFTGKKNADCQALADSTCSQVIEMCNSGASGTTEGCEVFNSSQKCWGKESQCGNPVFQPHCNTPTNTCEGGAMLTPVASASYEVGDVVHLKGWAADTDGINVSKVAVKVDGTTVGNATVHTACAPDNADAAICTAQGVAKKPVIWTYDYTVTSAGTHTFNVTWEDTKGITGANCAATRAITADVVGNPNWEISKTGSNVCIVDSPAGSQEARVDYVITVTNTGTAQGTLTKIVDTLDSKVKMSTIITSSPVPTASGHTLTWTLDATSGLFAPAQSREYKYSIIVPEASFGQYSNTVVATPSTGATFSSSEVVGATCSPVPNTGLFDSLAAKVIIGLGLIFISVIYLSSGNTIFDKISLVISDGSKVVLSKKGRAQVRKRKFEDRVAGK